MKYTSKSIAFYREKKHWSWGQIARYFGKGKATVFERYYRFKGKNELSTNR